jgi:serine protease Do
VVRGYLGIYSQDIDAGLAKSFNLPSQNGALVGNVFSNTPAAKAGIKAGDVITEINGKAITDKGSLQLAVSECLPGSPVTVKLFRDGHEKLITATLAELPAGLAQGRNDQDDSNSRKSSIDALDGVTVQDLNRGIRQQLEIPDEIRGALVTDVDQESNSAESGLQRGDVIVEINRQPVSNADDAVRLGRQAKGDQILLKIWRRQGDLAGTQFLSVDNTRQK